jgi:ABC-type antimicrobial peptide transport system permease subunit
MRRRGTDVGGADLDNTVVVPLQTAMRRLLNVPFIDALFLQARHVSDLDALEQNAIDILRGRLGTRSGVPVEFDVRNQSVLLRTQRGTSEAFRRLMIATAVFSLVAGAVSIMAVMMLSVRERVPEIALRRAVGARIRDVQWQFVIESALLATSGGMIGVVGGVGVAAIGAVVGQWEVAIPWQAIVAGLTFPIITGLVVGVVPAVRAARLDPGVGLRLHA